VRTLGISPWALKARPLTVVASPHVEGNLSGASFEEGLGGFTRSEYFQALDLTSSEF